MRNIDDFPTFLLAKKLLEMQHRNRGFLHFNKLHTFVLSQIIYKKLIFFTVHYEFNTYTVLNHLSIHLAFFGMLIN